MSVTKNTQKFYKIAKWIVIASFIGFVLIILKGKFGGTMIDSSNSLIEFALLFICVFFVIVMSLIKESEE